MKGLQSHQHEQQQWAQSQLLPGRQFWPNQMQRQAISVRAPLTTPVSARRLTPMQSADCAWLALHCHVGGPIGPNQVKASQPWTRLSSIAFLWTYTIIIIYHYYSMWNLKRVAFLKSYIQKNHKHFQYYELFILTSIFLLLPFSVRKRILKTGNQTKTVIYKI